MNIIPKQTRQEMFAVSIVPRCTNKNMALNLRQEPRICRLIAVKVSNLSCSSCCSLLREQRSTSLAYARCIHILKQEAGARRFSRAKRARRWQVDVGRLNSSTLAHEAQVAFLVHERLYLSVHVHPLGSFISWPTYLRFLPLHGFHKSVD